jgi:uncharacterized protein (DUF2336 family)
MSDRRSAPSREEILRLIESSSWTARAKGAAELAAAYCSGKLASETRRNVEDAFRILRFDAEVLVRRLLAECLKNARGLPRDIAMRLATDRADVAAPFLAHTPSLKEWDLLAILKEHPGAHRLAIAQRQRLGAELAEALCRCGEPEIVLATLENEAASIDPAILDALAADADQTIADAITRRRARPSAPSEPPGDPSHGWTLPPHRVRRAAAR